MVWEREVHDDLVLRNWDLEVLAKMTEQERKDAYQAWWGKGAWPHIEDPEKDYDDEERLRAKFWSKVHKRSQTICFYYCTNSQPMPKGEDIPLGMDDEDLINCGCLYD
ncbi:MAG: hypothetical protein M1815_002046, partial [Lichina confinis]